MDKTVEVSQAARDAAEEVAAIALAHHASGTGPCIGECFEEVLARFETTTRATQPEAALREAAAKIIAKDASNELDLGLLRQTHETGFKGGIRYCANLLAAALKDHRHG